MSNWHLSRRNFLVSSAAAGVAVTGAAASAQTAPHQPTDFSFEVSLSDDEWRERLTPEQFRIMREGGTEPAKSSPLWNEDRAGTYHCAACELLHYHDQHKVILDLGWLFFRHAEPLSVLVGIDGTSEMIERGDEGPQTRAVCRRCGSHMGHIVAIGGEILHCVNGAAFDFRPETV